MTSRRLMVSKTFKMEFENMTMSDIQFELHQISRKEMANEWTHVLKTALWRHSDVTMTSWWLFLSFSDDFWHFRFFYAFWAKNHHFCGFYGGGKYNVHRKCTHEDRKLHSPEWLIFSKSWWVHSGFSSILNSIRTVLPEKCKNFAQKCRRHFLWVTQNRIIFKFLTF